MRLPLGSLPVPATSMVGRADSLREVVRALRKVPLVTLTGPGGIGKSRLAIAVAESERAHYGDGVWHVDLSNVPAGGPIDEAILESLTRGDHSMTPSGRRLNDVVAGKRMLLILDNCEHVSRQVSVVTSDMLATARGLSVLATSRIALDSVGERVVQVPPLAVPDPDLVTDAAEVRAFDGVRLLVARAMAASPSFDLDQSNFREVAAVCSRLEGWPLAIELAASQLRSLTPAQLLETLDDRLALCSKDPATIARHTSLRAVIGWSWELCEPAARTLWQRASPFADGFDLDAARQVCSDERLPSEEIWRVMDSLVSNSILVATRGPSSLRFRFLETVRQFGREQLDLSAERVHYDRRHRDYFRSMTADAARAWDTAEQTASIRKIRAEKANITRALGWSLATPGEEEAGLEIAAHLRYHWAIDGSIRDGRRWLQRALDATTTDAGMRPTALWVLAWVTILQGDAGACSAALDEARELALARDDRIASTRAQVLRATALLWVGDAHNAVTSLRSALEFFRGAEDPGALLFTSMMLILALAEAGSAEEAESVATEALSVSGRSGELWGRAQSLWALGYCRWLAGDHEAAHTLVESSLNLRLDFDQTGTALKLETLVWVAASRREYERAATLLGGVQQLWKRLGTSISAFGIHFARHAHECEEALRLTMSAARFDSRVAAGRALHVEELINYALGKALANSSPDERHLTPRENEVSRFVGEGLSTEEIAERLTLSVRTVEGHLTHALAKLGFRSRTQLALWAAKRSAANRGM